MNYSITCFILSFGLLLNVAAQTSIEEKHKENIVKAGYTKQTNYKHNFVGDKPSPSGVKTAETIYDNKGNELQIVYFNPNGSIKGEEKYNYNSEGKKIYSELDRNGKKYISIYEYSGGNLIEEHGKKGGESYSNKYEFDGNGRTKKITYSTNDRINETREFSYSGNTTTVKVFNAVGSQTSTIKIIRDANDKLLEERTTSMTGEVLEKKIYKYSGSYLSEEVKFGQNNKLHYKYLYVYNSKGELIEYTEENPFEGKFVKKIFEYDSNGNVVILKWRNKPEEEFSVRTYKYMKGVKSEMLTYVPSYNFKMLFKYEYE